MLRAVIIDDADTARKKNIDLIQAVCTNVKIVAQANSSASAAKLIRQVSPDIVFTNAEFPDGNAFDLLEKFKPFAFKVIFLAKDEQFAIKAFRFSATDFLLKPIDPEDLLNAVAKAEESLNNDVFDLRLGDLFANLERPTNLSKIALKTANRIYSVNVQDIVSCEADKNYTTFYFINAPKLVISSTLKEFEVLLARYNFFRTHKSHLINMAYFDHFVKTEGGNVVVLKNRRTVPLSIRRKEAFLELLGN
jgi:two-component system LytT family response regulator